MTKTTIAFEASQFLSAMHRRSFSYVGAAMLIRAHLTLAKDNRLTRAAVHAIFNTRTSQSIALIDEVMDMAFREDDQQMVYSPAIDRAVAMA